MSGNLFEELRHKNKAEVSDETKAAVLATVDRLQEALHDFYAETRGTCNHAYEPECARDATKLRGRILQGVGGD